LFFSSLLVHPLAQLGISLLITDHRAKISKIINKRKMSLYRTNENIGKNQAFAGLDFRKWDALTASLYSECSFILKADISRFFYTAYTHSIPWAVIGKEKAKEWLIHNRKRLNSHWSSDFDTALQSCQSRETFGIPVGPDTSRIIAEVLLAGVEANANWIASVSGRPAFRLLDDYVIGFDEEASAQKALAALRSALWTFNLQLNEDKTTIAHARSMFKDKWKLEFEAIAVFDGDSARQETDIYRLVDLTLHFCSEAKSGAPAHWACRRLSSLKNVTRNFGIIVESLFRLARDFPSCTHHVAAFLINNQDGCQDPKIRKSISAWIKSTMRAHLQHAHDFEIAWCLLVSGVLRITINEDDLSLVDRRPNSVVLAMLGMLRERGLLSVPLSHWGWRADLKKSGILGQDWLPFYEAVRRKWTTDKDIISAVKGHPILAKMLAAKVTFLEDRIFDASRINIARRVFAKAAAAKPPRASTSRGWATTRPFDYE
jgi:Reverse transcriptase (RNA-dependent DNA polymerase)